MSGLRFEFPTEESLRDRQAAVMAKLGAADGPPPPEVVNRNPILWLTEPVRFPWLGRIYEVPPVPWPVGQQLDALWADIAKGETLPPGEEKRQALYDLTARACDLVFRCVRPSRRDPVRSLLWKLGLVRNPFLLASERQIAGLVGLLQGCRMRSGGRVSAPRDQSPPSSTSPTDSPNSSASSPHGLAPTGTR